MDSAKRSLLGRRFDRPLTLAIALGVTVGISVVMFQPADEPKETDRSAAELQDAPGGPITRLAGSVGRLSALAPADNSLLSPRLQVQAELNARERLEVEIASLIAEHGEEKAAALLAADASGDSTRGRASIEALTATWATDDPVAASAWLLQHTGENAPAESPLDAELWEAAVSGYIEGVADDDAETAAMLAELLPGQTRLPAYNPNNRQPRADRGAGSEPLAPPVDEAPNERGSDDAFTNAPAQEQDPTDTNNPKLPTEGQSPNSGRDPRFPGDPGFPGDPDYLTPR